MDDLNEVLRDRGFAIFDRDPRVARWATRAHAIARTVAQDAEMQAKWLRHGETWFVGVDALPNAPDGSIDGVALDGPWHDGLALPVTWHPAQLSIVYRGYPKRDEGEAAGAFRYRVKRAGAHVDGLHLENGRRIVRECHGFILGLPLNAATASPLVVWPESQKIIRAALRSVIGTRDPLGVDVTERYKAAREDVFARCEPLELVVSPGEAIVLDRHILHGIAADDQTGLMPDEGRMAAYFRPLMEDRLDWVRD